MDKFYVYVLESQRDHSSYIGITNNLQERLFRHNQERVASTKLRAPFFLVYHEKFSDQKAARRREKFLKSGTGRKVLKRILARVVELADTPA